MTERSTGPLRRLAVGTAGCAIGVVSWHAAAQPNIAENGPALAEPTVLLDEIIVTAQKRIERGQDVPLAVTAMNADAILDSGLLTLQRLTDLNPSVYFDTAQSFQRNSLQIRGIGTIGNSRSFEGAVGVFIDGVYRARSGMVLMDLLDIDNVEVLRGSQSTLFGKNTVAGSISMMSSKPQLHEAHGTLDMRLGNFSSSYFAGAVNVPIGDSAAVRVAGTYRERDGFFASPDSGDQYDAVDRFGFKAQFLFSPHEDVEVRLIADIAESDAGCCWSAALVDNGPTTPLIGAYSALNGLTFVAAPEAEQQRFESLNTFPEEKIEDQGLTAIVSWKAGNVAFSSITGIREWRHAQINADADFSGADLFVLNEPANIDSLSQEITASLEIGRSSLLIGGYFATEDYESLRSAETGGDADNYLNALISVGQGAAACLPLVVAVDCSFPVGVGALLPDGEFTRERYLQDSRSSAVFVHASTQLSDKFNLITGLRYSVEDKDGGVDNLFWYDSAVARAVLAAAGIPDDGTPRNGFDLIGTFYSPSFQDGIRDEETTGTLSLQYVIASNFMVYGGYHRGYKAGGVNLFREGAITDTTYRPETANSLELGFKAEYLGRRARTNVAVFDTDFSDLQINFFTGLEFRTENTGKATSRGIEIENYFQLTNRLRLDVAATYLEARFGDLDSPSLSYLDNRDMPRAPPWSAVTTLNYAKPLASGRVLFARGLVSYTGSHFVGAEIASETKASSYSIVDLSVGLNSRNQRWEALLWCTNCGDRDYRTVYFNSTFQPGSYSAYLNAQRQYGMALRAWF